MQRYVKIQSILQHFGKGLVLSDFGKIEKC